LLQLLVLLVLLVRFRGYDVMLAFVCHARCCPIACR
jgi:hypothetical protein